jgi:hypothetical protein
MLPELPKRLFPYLLLLNNTDKSALITNLLARLLGLEIHGI